MSAVAGKYSCHPQSCKNSFISCFCSISKCRSCRAWMELVAGARKWEGAAACIGSTSATAARKAGLTRIFYPESPGIEGCVISNTSFFLLFKVYYVSDCSQEYAIPQSFAIKMCCVFVAEFWHKNWNLAFSLHVFIWAYCFKARCSLKLRKTIWTF